MIPKILWSAWLGGEQPEAIKKCIASQKLCAEKFGYEYRIIDNSTTLPDIPYLNAAIKAKKYVKIVDFLKAYYLHEVGGVFMDADITVLPNKNFDALLTHKLFAAREENGFVGYSLVGAEKGNPLFKDYLEIVPAKFKGDDDLFFESSMEVFTNLAYSQKYDVTILLPEYFFVYNWQTGIIKATENSIALHDFYKSWKPEAPELLPFVSIIIPQLGRPEGLQRCLKSIDLLYYPKHLIEVLIEEGPDTVPNKVDQAFKRSKGQYLVYAANDVEFSPTSLYNALTFRDKYDLIAFNTGEVSPDEGNICEHFVISKTLATDLGGIFDTEFHHVGVDNLLWARAKKLGKAVRADNAIVYHYHFSKGFRSDAIGYTANPYDEVYQRGWENAEKDRELLKKKLEQLYA